MSISLAVWEGEAVTSDAEAAARFEELYARYVEADDATPPTPAIRSYVEVLLSRYPDIADEGEDFDEDAIPWQTGPLINEASGPLFYFGMITNRVAAEAWDFAVATARTHGLVCFDPQSGTLA